jgi:hypothetical protein
MPDDFTCQGESAATRWVKGIKPESFRLIGLQLHEKYKENFDILSEGPSLGS